MFGGWNGGMCSHELRVSITQAHRLKRQQLGEADVSTPQFALFFYRQGSEQKVVNACKRVLDESAMTHDDNLLKSKKKKESSLCLL
jgi:hypothetical protein